MKIRVSNISEVAVGVDPLRPPLQPGETTEMDVDDDTLTSLEGFSHVEVQHLDRPTRGGNKKAAPGD